jgi:serine/threonine protein kinase
VESARWTAEIAEAIQYLDEHGVLCWDLKPGTIILSPEGRAMLTDLWEHSVTADEAV